MDSRGRFLFPLMVIAAIAVVILSIAGIASITG